MTMTPMTDLGGQTLADVGKAKIQTAADATYIAGAEVDRQGYDSCLVIAHAIFTSASGASGATNVLTLSLFDDTATGMGTEAIFDTDTYTYTWAADGANDGVHVLPVNLETANRYIRGKVKLTESGTITISSQMVALHIVLGGMVRSPDSSWAAAGYETTTEAS